MNKKITNDDFTRRIKDIENSKLNIQTKEYLIKLFQELFKITPYESEFNGFFTITVKSENFLANIPKLLCDILSIYEQKDYYCSKSTDIYYTIKFPASLINSHFSIDYELKSIEKIEKKLENNLEIKENDKKANQKVYKKTIYSTGNEIIETNIIKKLYNPINYADLYLLFKFKIFHNHNKFYLKY